jgi:hypothetical protein
MNSVGRRGARPQSWNVPTSSSSTQKDSIKSLQEHLNDDQKKVHHFPPVVVNAGYSSVGAHGHPNRNQSPSPVPSGPNDDHNGSSSPHLIGSAGAAAAAGGSIDSRSLLQRPEKEFLDQEKDKKAKLEEERLERWMRKGGTRVDGTTSPDPRSFSPSPNPSATLPRFQDGITSASRALRSKKSEDVAKWSLAAATYGRSIGEALNDDEIRSFSRALESAIVGLRTSLDDGGDGFEHYHEVSTVLGQLYVSVIGAL